jgi:ABC-type ATPase involved in cell division
MPDDIMSGAAGLAIRTEDLRKTYKSSRGDVPAVRGIDLSVDSGQFFGLLGPNGAGKSTTIGMLTTLVLPTAGRAWVAGLDVVADPVGVKRRIGVVTQNNTLDMQLTVAENLEFRSRFFGLGLREASRRAAQLLEVFGLADRRKAMSTDLSGGQAKRLPGAPPGRAVPGRADRRARPADQGQPVGHPAGAARRGADHPADHALHGGSRGAVRAGLGDRPR